MRKKESLKYDPVLPQEGANEITARLVAIKGEDHLLIDYWRDGHHTGRTVFTKDNYSTYDYEEKRWTQATGYNLELDGRSELCCNDHIVSAEHEKMIRKFYGKKRYNVEDCITGYMWEIQRRKKTTKIKKKTRIMEEHFEKLEDLQEEYLNECAEKMKYPESNAIWYKRKGMKSTYVCGCCGKEWQRSNRVDTDEELNWAQIPKAGKKGSCPYCKEEGTLLQLGRAKIINQCQEFGDFELLKDKTVAYRHIRIHRTQYPEGKEQFEAKEIMRVFFDKENKVHEYCINYSCYYGYQWGTGKYYISEDTEIKEGWLCIFKQSEPLKYFEKEMVQKKILDAAMAFVKIPQFEICYKMGLLKLCGYFENMKGDIGRYVNKKAKTMDGFLKVRKCHVKEIVEKAGDRSRINLYQEEKRLGIQWNEKEWELVRKTGVDTAISMGELHNIEKFTSIQKACNYIEKQKEKGEYGGMEFAIRTHYADYLNMREALGYDMTNTVFLFPRNLEEQHNAMVAEKKRRENEKYIQDMMKKYPKIAKRASTLNKKWSYKDEKYLVRAANSAEEIIIEGRTQHHCVGTEQNGYLKKHNDGKSTIFLMRKADKPDVPFVTIEICDGAVRQWYGKNDKKNIEGVLNEEEVDQWLDNWIKTKKMKEVV